MAKWKCKYGTSFCGSFGELCEECKKDTEAARRGHNTINLTTMSREELLSLRRRIDAIIREKEEGIRISVRF